MMDWNSRYLNQDTPWEKGAAAPPLEELLEEPAARQWFGAGLVIVPGCGTGHDVRLIARRLGVGVVGIDVAPVAIKLAERAEAVGTECYHCGNWFDYTAADRTPSAIFEHTCFCAIDPADRARYAATATRLLPPGGHLIGIFFFATGDGDGPPWDTDEDELMRLFGPHFTLIRSWVPGRAFAGREGAERVMVWRRNARHGHSRSGYS